MWTSSSSLSVEHCQHHLKMWAKCPFLPSKWKHSIDYDEQRKHMTTEPRKLFFSSPRMLLLLLPCCCYSWPKAATTTMTTIHPASSFWTSSCLLSSLSNVSNVSALGLAVFVSVCLHRELFVLESFFNSSNTLKRLKFWAIGTFLHLKFSIFLLCKLQTKRNTKRQSNKSMVNGWDAKIVTSLLLSRTIRTRSPLVPLNSLERTYICIYSTTTCKRIF